MAEERNIKYVNREFSDFKSTLEEFAKNYFPDSYNDFSPASPGTMFIEMAAYVGDILAFYQDTQLQETFVQYAKDPANLYTLAYMMGYRPKVTSVSEVELEVTQNVDATGGNTPNWDQALFVQANAEVQASSNSETVFTIPSAIDFTISSSYNPTEVTITGVSGGNPSEFQLKKTVKAFSGVTNTITSTVPTIEKFRTIEIEDDDIIRVLEIVDGDGNRWYEVPYLGQDTVYVEEANAGNIDVPYNLTLQKVPRRFVTRFTSQGVLQIQFGPGVAGVDDTEFLPDPTNVGLGTAEDSSYSGSISRLDYAYDPSNFLFTNSYGLAPTSDLTIKYLTGGGVAANVPANTVVTQRSVTTTATDTSKAGTLAFNNPKAATGGRDGDTVDELRQNSLRAFGEQSRAVTLQDYTVRALSLPPKFGSVAKVFVTQDQATNSNLADNIVDNNPLSLSLYVLSYDVDKKLTTATTNLKQNLKTYLSQYMILTDSVNVKDAFIVNIGVKFDIIVRPDFVGRQVLLDCNQALRTYFDTDKRSINQPINLSKLFSLLDRVKGVQTVQKIEIVNKVSGDYSEYAYDIPGATRNNIVYPSYDPMIFEVKFPLTDIEGRITTL